MTGPLLIDHSSNAARKFSQQIINALRPYIPDACLRDASSDLFNLAHQNGLELTSLQQREEYEAMKRLALGPRLRGFEP